MTSSLFRGRPRRRAPASISARVLYTVLGGLTGLVWLVLPGVTSHSTTPVPTHRTTEAPADQAPAPATVAAETSATDLVVPLVAVVVAVVLGGYGYLRRTRRARTRTTPARSAPYAGSTPPPLSEVDEQVRTLLVEADDWVRVAREELDFAEASLGAPAVIPYVRAVREAEAELSAAFRMREQYDAGVPEDPAERRQALAGIIGRCQEAGWRLDTDADGFDRLRGLERGSAAGLADALVVAETRFRRLAGSIGGAEARLVGLGARYGTGATASVTGYPEQARDRLVFATARLNASHQCADRGEPDRAARHLRAAEGAIAQADGFVTAVDRLATTLASADRLLPSALTDAEADLAQAHKPTPEHAPPPATPGRLRPDPGPTGATRTAPDNDTSATPPTDPDHPHPDNTPPEPPPPEPDLPHPESAPGTAPHPQPEQPLPESGPAAATPAEPDQPHPEGTGGGASLAQPDHPHPENGPAAATPAEPDQPLPEGTGGGASLAQPALSQAEFTGVPRRGWRAFTVRRSSPPVLPASRVAGGEAVDSPYASGELGARVESAGGVLGGVRRMVAGGVYDPLDALRRVVVAMWPLDPGRTGAVAGAAALVAEHATADADTFVGTHRGAVGSEARTRLAAAVRQLEADPVAADAAARRARELAERDVRAHGNPLTGATGHESGLAGTLLGGVLLSPASAHPAAAVGPPPSFGGPRTWGRRAGEPA
ncbi:hypothetical protein [Streptomyces sp. NPDC087212]|uniref:hypothetical protein n=1 Tax=Streptomyces sp. NPDC087212 TaxID=3365766 RepID=UPI0038063BA1